MKKKKKRVMFNSVFSIVVLAFIFTMFILFLTIKQLMDKPEIAEPAVVTTKNDPFADVKKYTPILHDELAKYDLEGYTVILAAVMHQESRGKGGDPMQSSESAGLPPNTIDDPKESIKLGVKHFNHVIQYGLKKDVDFSTIIQSYNMGPGYIEYIAKNGGKHSEKLAKKFSLKQVKKNPDLYNCGGNKENFRYPYCYGDFTYTSKVEKNIESLTSDSIPAITSEQITSEAF